MKLFIIFAGILFLVVVAKAVNMDISEIKVPTSMEIKVEYLRGIVKKLFKCPDLEGNFELN